MVDLWVGISLNNVKHVKKIDEELLLVAWQSKRMWDWYISEDEKKKLAAAFYSLKLTITLDYYQPG